jgi:uncharacterized protein (TIGR00255 family)
MLVSMTGYGRGQYNRKNEKITVEIKSLNNRFFEFQYFSPRFYLNFEKKAREIIQKHVHRGTVSVAVNTEIQPLSTITPDMGKIKNYMTLLNRIRKKYRVSGPVTLDHLLSMPDIYSQENSHRNAEGDWPKIKTALDMAVQSFLRMRRKEGQSLQRDISKRLAAMSAAVNSIQKRAPRRIKNYGARLRKKTQALISKGDLEKSRLNAEIVMLAEKMDITEEITRLKSHFQLFNRSLKARTEQKGKKLNFILQEMNREVNTICSKANDTEISHRGVLIKEELEKIREQVQNIE